MDTSIPSFLFAEDSPEKRDATEKFWKLLSLNLYEIILSDLLFQEVGNSPIQLKTSLENSLAELDATFSSITAEADELALQYVKPALFRKNIMTMRSILLLQH